MLQPLCAPKSERLKLQKGRSRSHLNLRSPRQGKSNCGPVLLNPVCTRWLNEVAENPSSIRRILGMANRPEYRVNDQVKRTCCTLITEWDVGNA